MFRIVKNQTLKDYQHEIEMLKYELAGKSQIIKTLREDNERSFDTINSLNEKLEKFESSTNEVVTKISTDLTQVTPIVRYNPEIVEKLIELGYVNDATAQDKFAIQLALITVAQEALTQLVESFSEELEEV